MFSDILISRIRDLKNPTVAGLDPKIEYVPEYLIKKSDNKAMAVYEYNKMLIDSLYDIVPAVKCQSAYYELLGPLGSLCLKNTMDYAHEKGMLVIMDGKRNDIDSTAQAYAKAYLDNGEYYSDAITVNPYLGYDGIKPFIDKCISNQKGIFVLLKTSNPSSGDIQDVTLDTGKKLYEHVGGLISKWSEGHTGKYGYSFVGAVIGATYPQILKDMRKSMKHTIFLVPGYGSQGAGASDIGYAFDENKNGAIINASRSILCAWQKRNMPHEQFHVAARLEAIEMRNEIQRVINL